MYGETVDIQTIDQDQNLVLQYQQELTKVESIHKPMCSRVWLVLVCFAFYVELSFLACKLLRRRPRLFDEEQKTG